MKAETGRREIVDHIGYYDAERRQAALVNVSPTKFEKRWRAGATGPTPAQRHNKHRNA